MKLENGETPWDTMPVDDLRFEVARLYQALVAANNALRLSAQGSRSGFWGKRGTGGEALAVSEHALEPYVTIREDLYRSYFRMRGYLISGGTYGIRWMLCPHPDGDCYGEDRDGKPTAICPLHGLPTEPLTWESLKGGLIRAAAKERT